MLRVRPLFESALVRIERIDHPAGIPHVDPDHEMSGNYSINVLERGGFSVTHGQRHWKVGLADLFVTVPGQTFRYGHDAREHAPDDVCVAVCFKSDAHDEIGAFDVEALARRTPVVPLDNRRAYLRRRLLAHLSGPPDSLAIDSLSGELLAATVAGTTSRLH